MGSHQQNEIVERRIKELNLGSRTMLWNFSFKTACQRYNILEIYEYGNTLKQNVSGLEFQICPTEYHTWGALSFP